MNNLQFYFKKIIFLISIVFFFILISCSGQEKKQKTDSKTQILAENSDTVNKTLEIITGAEQLDKYINLLIGKKVGLVVNQTSLVGNKHLLDVLLENNINIVKIFALEHGFRGNADRGKHISNSKDEKTGTPIVAIFGKNRKPPVEQISDLDIVVFDVQDVGVRFFTYISSMHNVMEACAENNKDFLVLDRPNPLGDYVAGPVRKAKYKSFVGMHPIPIVHGLTVGELAGMINGELWLKGEIKCNLKVIKVENYKHSDKWSLPVKPSPNLPTDISIRLYPALCLFEATSVSIGRGTKFPFQVIGYPDSTFGNFTFTPKDIEGMQTNPLHEGKLCYGEDLRKTLLDTKFTLKYFINYYNQFEDKSKFVTRENWFNLLIGNSEVLKQIKSGMSEIEIEKTWETELKEYNEMRVKYLLYDK